MSSSRSRSEIETALSGNQRVRKRKKSARPTQQDLDIDTNTSLDFQSSSPRRQQVIGGDLSGVSGRHKRGLLNKLSGMHITNWIALTIVLCILIAFFWPHSSDEPIREVSAQNVKTQTKTENFYTESRIDEPPQQAPSEAVSFGRENDLNRANQYREEEERLQQVELLFSKVKEHLENGRYTAPANKNALHEYHAILKIDPFNSEANAGIASLKERFLSAGLDALNQGDEKVAASALGTLSRIGTETSEYQELSSALEIWRQNAKIEDLLNKAVAAKEADNIILPANVSSLSYYKQVLALDAENQTAIEGISNIADLYIDRANTALLRGDLDAAAGYLATASVVDDKHSSIDIVREMITNAKPIIKQTQATRKAQEAEAKTNSRTQNASPVQTPPASDNQNRVISDTRTPSQQADEQAQFDQVYLDKGLDAYYRGEYEASAALLQPLADKGISRAQFRIAYMHYLGRGFKQNRAEADRIIRAALPAIKEFANEGRSWAQSDLGSLYEDGLVLPRNFSEAVFWYRSSATQGYAGAQTNLGIMYARGRGVPQNRKTAIEWFQRAAKQGDIAAQRNLESMGVN